MKVKTLKIFSDSGHAWCKVDRSELIELDILKDISTYSYQKNNFVYLEEDQDLNIYINSLKLKYKNDINWIIKFNESVSQRSRIRNYKSFHFLKDEIETLKDRALECKKYCYAAKGFYQWPNVKEAQKKGGKK
jgi:hypothetical protein